MHGNRCTGTTHVVGHSNLRSIDLPTFCIAAELGHNLVDLLDTRSPDRVPAGLEAPAGIDRQVPVQCGHAFHCQSSCLSLFTESEVLDCTYLCDGKAVMHLYEVDILRCDPGCFKCPLSGGNRCIKRRNISPVVQGNGVACLFTGEYPDRGVGKFPGTVQGRYDYRCCAVRDW